MKTKIISLCVCAALLMTGCSTSQLTNNTASDSTSKKTEPQETSAPTSTPAPEETTLALGKKGTSGDWEIKAKKASVKKKIKAGEYREFKPREDDNTYVVISLSVRNNGKQAADFIPRVGRENTMTSATLLYKDEYEYAPTELLSYDDDLVTRKVQPLSTEKGIIAFEVPKKVAKDLKQLKLKIGTKAESIVYSLG